MQEPKLDWRDRRDILQEVKALAESYVPEWRWNEEAPDVGVVLAQVFSEMMENTISLYNRTPRNHHLSFLNLTDAKVKPPAPAEGMISVGVPLGSAYIPRGASVYAAADTESGRVFYETTEDMEAVATGLQSVFFTSSKRDEIRLAYRKDQSEGDEPIHLFDFDRYPQLQSHFFYLRDDASFFIRDIGCIQIRLFHNRSVQASERLPFWFGSENAVWEHYTKAGWCPVDSLTGNQDGITLRFHDGNLLFSLDGEEGYWLRCQLKRIPEGGIRLTDILYEASNEKLMPDTLATDTAELTIRQFCPFGEQLMVFSSFYIRCEEAFIKAESTIQIQFEMDFRKSPIATSPDPIPIAYRSVMTPEDFETGKETDIWIERVIWEYWNGFGWARLFPAGEGMEFFTPKSNGELVRTLRFSCPRDMDRVVMGAAEGHFIRARLDKLSSMVWTKGSYLIPFVHGLAISYHSESAPVRADAVTVESNVERRRCTLPDAGVAPLMEAALCENPAVYLCLEGPLSGGPIRILFDMAPGDRPALPALRWEYLGRNGKGEPAFQNLEVMDSTKNLSVSGIVTLIGKKNFVKQKLFGAEGYFIRFVNSDGWYDNWDARRVPVLRQILFNTVPVIQLERHIPEFFYIGRGEEKKQCRLSDKLCDAEVWVNEQGALSVKEEAALLSGDPENIRVRRDDTGAISAIWVRWRQVNKLGVYSGEERVYTLDFAAGAVCFGDGRHGRIPPDRIDESIEVRYVTCDGTLGNIPSYGILDFSSSPAGVSYVTNHKPIEGGSPRETVDQAAERTTGELLSQNRLVTQEDLERMLLASNRSIHRIRCLPHVDRFGRPATGKLAVAVLPREYGRGAENFIRTEGIIRRMIREQAPLQLVAPGRTEIFEVRYVEICVRISAAISDYNLYHEVYQAIHDRLAAFLNPISGNFSGEGWKIGQLPAREQIYNNIKTIRHLKWIKSLHIFPYLMTETGREAVDLLKLREDRFAVPVFGEPEISLLVEQSES